MAKELQEKLKTSEKAVYDLLLKIDSITDDIHQKLWPIDLHEIILYNKELLRKAKKEISAFGKDTESTIDELITKNQITEDECPFKADLISYIKKLNELPQLVLNANSLRADFSYADILKTVNIGQIEEPHLDQANQLAESLRWKLRIEVNSMTDASEKYKDLWKDHFDLSFEAKHKFCEWVALARYQATINDVEYKTEIKNFMNGLADELTQKLGKLNQDVSSQTLFKDLQTTINEISKTIDDAHNLQTEFPETLAGYVKNESSI